MPRQISWPDLLFATVGLSAVWLMMSGHSAFAAMRDNGSPQILLAQAPQAQPRQNVEANIVELHNKLQITPAQEAQFNTVAAVMRENAKLEASAPQLPASASAVDDLRAYIKYSELELTGLKKMLPALEALYAILSPAQKKAADAVFREGPGG
jgi:hypothetical protein